MDFGTPERYFDATWDILEGRIQTEVVTNSDGVHIAPDAEVDPNATIGPRAVIGPGVKVGPGARVNGSVLLDRSEVGANATVEASIIGPGVNNAAGDTVGDEGLGKNQVGEVINA